MDIAEFQILDVSNAGAFGMEWTHPETKSTFQTVFNRIDKKTGLGFRKAGGKFWSFVHIVEPERFGEFPKSNREALEYTRRFIEASES